VKQFIKTALLFIMSIVVSGLIGESAARVGFPQWREFLSEWFMDRTVVPGFGAVLIGRAGFDGYFSQNNGDFRAHIKINDFGFRQPGPISDSDGRIWVVGDSYAFGWGVDGEQMTSSKLAVAANFPTYNIASPGADICGYQALVSRVPKKLKPRGIIVMLTLENDIRIYNCAAERKPMPSASDASIRFNLPTAKEFMMKHSALYNFSAVTVKRSSVLREFFVTVGLLARAHVKHGSFSAADITRRVASVISELKNLRDMVPVDTPFATLLIPARFEIRDNDGLFRQLRETVKKQLLQHNFDVIDPFGAFRKAGFAATHFAHDGHWSPRGHEIAADAGAQWIQSRSLK
jgi:hypothetical protein